MRYPGQHDDGKDDQNKPCKEHDEARDCVPGYAPSTTTASCDFRFGGHSVTSGRWPGGSASSMTSGGGTPLGKSLTCGVFLVIPQPAHAYPTAQKPLAPAPPRASAPHPSLYS